LGFLFLLLHAAFRTTSFLELRYLAFFLCDQVTVFFGNYSVNSFPKFYVYFLFIFFVSSSVSSKAVSVN
jgi:hypothetical protein